MSIEHNLPKTMYIPLADDGETYGQSEGSNSLKGLYSECGLTVDEPRVIGVYKLVEVLRVQPTESVRVLERTKP